MILCLDISTEHQLVTERQANGHKSMAYTAIAYPLHSKRQKNTSYHFRNTAS